MEFIEAVRKFVKVTPENADKILVHIVVKLYEELSLITPVGNPALWAYPAPKGYAGGHLRRNWQISINSMPNNEIPGIDPTGAISLAENSLKFDSIKLGNKHYIINNTSYGPIIDKGRHIDDNGVVRGSLQAPAGMVGPVLSMFTQFLKEAEAKI